MLLTSSGHGDSMIGSGTAIVAELHLQEKRELVKVGDFEMGFNVKRKENAKT